LVKGQEKNMAQLERIGTMIEWRWSLEREIRKEKSGDDVEGMAPEKVRRRGLCYPPPVSILVLFFSLIEFLFSMN